MLRIDKIVSKSNLLMNEIFQKRNHISEIRSDQSLIVSGKGNIGEVSRVDLNKDLVLSEPDSKMNKTVYSNAGFRSKPSTALHLRNLSTRANAKSSRKGQLQTLPACKLPSPHTHLPAKYESKKVNAFTTPLDHFPSQNAFKSFDAR